MDGVMSSTFGTTGTGGAGSGTAGVFSTGAGGAGLGAITRGLVGRSTERAPPSTITQLAGAVAGAAGLDTPLAGVCLSIATKVLRVVAGGSV